MEWKDALIAMEGGFAVKRIGWGFSERAYIMLLPLHIPKNLAFFIYEQYAMNHTTSEIGYGITYLDITATDWCVIAKPGRGE